MYKYHLGWSSIATTIVIPIYYVPALGRCQSPLAKQLSNSLSLSKYFSGNFWDSWQSLGNTIIFYELLSLALASIFNHIFVCDQPLSINLINCNSNQTKKKDPIGCSWNFTQFYEGNDLGRQFEIKQFRLFNNKISFRQSWPFIEIVNLIDINNTATITPTKKKKKSVVHIYENSDSRQCVFPLLHLNKIPLTSQMTHDLGL